MLTRPRRSGWARTGTPCFALARDDPDDPGEPIGMTQIALRISRAANGVSRRHGETARAMWQPMFPGRAPSRCRSATSPTACTSPTWMAAPMRELLDRHLGDGLGDARRRRRPPGRGSTRSPTPSCGRCAASCARAGRVRPRARHASIASRAARRRTTWSSRLTPSIRTPDGRLRAPPRHLQAPAPADPRPAAHAAPARAASGPSRSCSPARRTRRTTGRSASCSRSSAPRASAARRRAGRLPARLRHGAGAVISSRAATSG